MRVGVVGGAASSQRNGTTCFVCDDVTGLGLRGAARTRPARAAGSRRAPGGAATRPPEVAVVPSQRNMVPNLASQMRTAFASMALKTGSSSPGELVMTRSTSRRRRLLLQRLGKVRPGPRRARGCALQAFFQLGAALRSRPTRVLAFVPVERSLRPLRSALRPLARQGHLVGTVTGPLPVGPSQGSSLSILTEPHDELAPPHSITSSARASSVGGISRPSAFAVIRLMTRSNLVGCSTGRSAGFAPRRILST